MSKPEDFIIENGVLKKYTGTDENIIIPDGVKIIGKGAFHGKCFFTKIKLSDISSQIKPAAVRGFVAEYYRSSMPESMISEYCTYIRRQRKKYFREMAENPALLQFAIDRRLITLEDTEKIIDSATDVEIRATLFVYKDSFPAEEKIKLENQNEQDLEKIMGLKTPSLKDYKRIFDLDYVRNGDGYLLKKYSGTDESVIIPECINNLPVLGIGKGAFKDCIVLTSVSLPESIKVIGDDAFCGCKNLESVTIPHSVVSIGKRAFKGCSKISHMVIPEGVAVISENLFSDCSSLASVTLPESITRIEERAFWKCEIITDIFIPCNVVSIGCRAFSFCYMLNNIKIPEGITAISDETFRSCHRLKNIEIPDSVTSIGDSAFESCKRLKSITIPDSVTSIGKLAFCFCKNLTINCRKNSCAHKYAIEKEIRFELIEE